MLRQRRAAVLCLLGLLVLNGVLYAQEYPNKPVRIITNPAGGDTDFLARIIGPGISESLGQPVVVDNRSAGLLAAEAAAKSLPDGYTLLFGGGGTWTTPLLGKAPYDPVTDFATITQISRDVFILIVHPSLPVKTVADLVKLAKARPGDLNYSYSGTGGAQFGMELLKSMAGVNIVSVAYKGVPAANTAVATGEIQMTIANPGLVTSQIQSGKIKALAVTSATPSTLVPGVPTLAATGVPGYEWVGASGAWAPAKTPVAIITRLNREIVRVLNRPEVKEKLLNAGVEVIGSSPEEFAALVKSQITKTIKIIKDAGIKVGT